MDSKNIEQFLKLHDIKPSHHRMRVYEYLVTNRNHPSVDVIFQELVKEIPTLSRTTLYNTLNLFVEKGIVTPITIAENELRYDADTSVHGHLRCNRCGQIFDIWLDAASLDLKGTEGFKIEESHIYFKGLCPKCLM